MYWPGVGSMCHVSIIIPTNYYGDILDPHTLAIPQNYCLPKESIVNMCIFDLYDKLSQISSEVKCISKVFISIF